MSKRNPMARALSNPVFRRRVLPDKRITEIEDWRITAMVLGEAEDDNADDTYEVYPGDHA